MLSIFFLNNQGLSLAIECVNFLSFFVVETLDREILFWTIKLNHDWVSDNFSFLIV
jgi:hypothetical protein